MIAIMITIQQMEETETKFHLSSAPIGATVFEDKICTLLKPKIMASLQEVMQQFEGEEIDKK